MLKVVGIPYDNHFYWQRPNYPSLKPDGQTTEHAAGLAMRKYGQLVCAFAHFFQQSSCQRCAASDDAQRYVGRDDLCGTPKSGDAFLFYFAPQGLLRNRSDDKPAAGER